MNIGTYTFGFGHLIAFLVFLFSAGLIFVVAIHAIPASVITPILLLIFIAALALARLIP